MGTYRGYVPSDVPVRTWYVPTFSLVRTGLRRYVLVRTGGTYQGYVPGARTACTRKKFLSTYAATRGSNFFPRVTSSLRNSSKEVTFSLKRAF